MGREPVVLGIDPGHKKCGLALVGADGNIVARCVAPAELVGEVVAGWLAKHPVEWIVVGDGTRSAEVREAVEAVAGEIDVTVVDERETTLAARRRYWEVNPPRGLWRWVPTTMRVPPVPYDDLVAVLLAERWWRDRKGAAT